MAIGSPLAAGSIVAPSIVACVKMLLILTVWLEPVYRFFARPANGLSEVRNAMRIGTPGMSNESRRLLTR